MDTKLKGKIINALRRLTYSYSPRNEAANKQKVAAATFKCELCDKIVYKGTSKEIPAKILEEFPECEKGKIALDHREPVIPINGYPNKEWDWNIYIERMFCDSEGFQAICFSCHKEKTYQETQLRKKSRKLNKS